MYKECAMWRSADIHDSDSLQCLPRGIDRKRCMGPHYMIFYLHQVSAVVSPPSLPPLVPHDPMMDIFLALDAIDASIAQMDTEAACPSRREDVVQTPTSAASIQTAGVCRLQALSRKLVV
uniref:Uncharacterized protein n=1 Tax=Timema shepardi TaxID=629360 RepID=A0A7R9G3S5_TIMSH|nr:unnamed protein product [Timema shepardi]